MKRRMLVTFMLAAAHLLAVSNVRAEPAGLAEEVGNGSATAEVLDLNTASAAQLEALPGIGPAKAQAILAFRNARGGFRQVAELMRIKGIGRAMLRRLRAFVTVKGGG